MAGHLIGRDQAELEARGLRLAEVLPSLQGQSGADVVSSLRDQLGRWFVGTPAEIVEQMRPYVASGVGLFMLQHYVLDDMEALNLLASEVMPRLS
jgi:alkanesulfonate monooxygenase SsuD/methylene tetrahydromethanopterin reductase-like flavin-dependent oxidoreductase (luciferase family)